MENNYELENQEPLNLLHRIGAIYTDPKSAFESLREKPKFFGAYIVVILISCISLLWRYFDGSAEKMLIDTLVSTGQPVTEQIITISKMIALFGGLFVIIVVPFIVAFFYHLMVMINSETGYKKTLTIVSHSSLISGLNSIITILILKITGITIQFSPAMFLDISSVDPIIYTLLSFLNIFIIWQMLVNIIGFKTIHHMPTKNAIITTVVPTLCVLIISVLVIIATS